MDLENFSLHPRSKNIYENFLNLNIFDMGGKSFLSPCGLVKYFSSWDEKVS